MSEAAIAASVVDPSGETTRKLARFWGTRLCRTCGVEIATQGGERVVWNEPLIVMANHQSFLDIPVLYAALPEPFGMLAKQELFRVPIFSAAMRGLRCIPIDRDNVRQSLASLRQAAEQIELPERIRGNQAQRARLFALRGIAERVGYSAARSAGLMGRAPRLDAAAMAVTWRRPWD